MQENWVFGTLCFIKESFSGTHNEEVVKGIAEFPLDNLNVEEVEIDGEVKPRCLI